MRRLLRFLGWKDRQPGDIPPFPFAASEGLWRRLTRPVERYPPVVPRVPNHGLGWSGDERTRPFAPPAPPQFRQPTVHENINGGSYAEQDRKAASRDGSSREGQVNFGNTQVGRGGVPEG